MPEEEGGSLIHVSIKAEPLFHIGPFEFTNSMVGALLATAVLLAAAWYFHRNSRLIPGRMQSLIELPVEWMTSIISASTTRWRGYASLITTFFLMILVANWIGLLPGVGTIGVIEHAHGEDVLVPLIRPASADLNFTLGLAIVSFVVFVWWGVRINGPGGYLKELVGEPRYMAPLMFPIHLISELSRLISLSMRLFGNVFAGEVLLATMLALTYLVVPAVFLGLEAVFGFVQALVFSLLAMTYITLAIAEHHAGGNGHEGEEPHNPNVEEGHPTDVASAPAS
ncbi:MAG TPA: F0F1 ATP synthase subunit A [Candidatus Limnocylindrales bacterium]|nr:F0F1 ATP synthase subunit A [Candidatus Limnocylindrales bacterium]